MDTVHAEQHVVAPVVRRQRDEPGLAGVSGPRLDAVECATDENVDLADGRGIALGVFEAEAVPGGVDLVEHRHDEVGVSLVDPFEEPGREVVVAPPGFEVVRAAPVEVAALRVAPRDAERAVLDPALEVHDAGDDLLAVLRRQEVRDAAGGAAQAQVAQALEEARVAPARLGEDRLLEELVAPHPVARVVHSRDHGHPAARRLVAKLVAGSGAVVGAGAARVVGALARRKDSPVHQRSQRTIRSLGERVAVERGSGETVDPDDEGAPTLRIFGRERSGHRQ